MARERDPYPTSLEVRMYSVLFNRAGARLSGSAVYELETPDGIIIATTGMEVPSVVAALLGYDVARPRRYSYRDLVTLANALNGARQSGLRSLLVDYSDLVEARKHQR
jgi:hypothetical protein